MHIALISTFPPAECGIGNYSRELVDALAAVAPDIKVTVIAEQVEGVEDRTGVVRAWHRRGDWVHVIHGAIAAVQPDVVHVQHEEALFGQDRRIVELLARLRVSGARTIATLHSVYDGRHGRDFHRALAAVCDRLVAHQRAGMASVLQRQGVAARQIELIPHGTPHFVLVDRAAARAQLGLPADDPLALFFGFIHFGKRLHVALSAFERARDRLGSARFVVAGRIRRSHALDRIYEHWIERQLRRGEAASSVIYRPGFVPVEHKAAYYAAADLIVLPHDQAYGSASGVLHEAIAANRAILCTRGKKFAEAVEAVSARLPEAFPAPGDRRAWQDGFVHFLTSEVHRRRAEDLLATLRDQTSWRRAATLHAAMYRQVAGEPAASSAIRRA